MRIRTLTFGIRSFLLLACPPSVLLLISAQVSIQLSLQGGETAILISNCGNPFGVCAGSIDGDAGGGQECSVIVVVSTLAFRKTINTFPDSLSHRFDQTGALTIDYRFAKTRKCDNFID
jgi:hypothetical protein